MWVQVTDHRSMDPWAEPSAVVWAKDVVDNMLPKLVSSSVMVSLVPTDGKGDVKFWVELGAAIMLDKPILAVVFGDNPVPAKMALVADEVVRLPDGVNAAGSKKLAAAVKRLVRE